MLQGVPGFGTKVRCVTTLIFYSGKSEIYLAVASWETTCI